MIPANCRSQIVTAYPISQAMLDASTARSILDARAAGKSSARVSIDLGMSDTEVGILSDGVELSENLVVGWRLVQEIVGSGERCFAVEPDGECWPVGIYSETTGWYRSLIRTGGTPTTLVGGFTMHRIKDSDPMDDTREKINVLRPVTGAVLDTATGLGYTAIEAAESAESVLTVEVDPAAIEIIRYNPWSHRLLTSDNITIVAADIHDLIHGLRDASFDRIIHDPPTLSLAGELYSEAFYRELYRVLNRRGRLFHYIGDPTSRSGRRTTDGVIRRLQAAGFERVRRTPKAFGVVAYR